MKNGKYESRYEATLCVCAIVAVAIELARFILDYIVRN